MHHQDRRGHRSAQSLRQDAAGLGHRRRHSGRVLAGLPRALGAEPGLPFGCRGAAQRIRAPTNGIRPLFGGADRQPGLHLGGAGGVSRRNGLLPFRRGGIEQRRLLGVVQALLEPGDPERAAPVGDEGGAGPANSNRGGGEGDKPRDVRSAKRARDTDRECMPGEPGAERLRPGAGRQRVRDLGQPRRDGRRGAVRARALSEPSSTTGRTRRRNSC